MTVYVYIFGRLPCGKDEIEDALESVLGDRGGVTGSGSGPAGSNFDMLINDESMTGSQVLTLARQGFADFNLPVGTIVDLDGARFPLVGHSS
jgi:hypothetical protein